MRTIEAKAIVSEDGKLTIQLPPDISPGEYQIVMVIESQPVEKKRRSLFKFPVDSYGPWPVDLSLRREDMYSDDGR